MRVSRRYVSLEFLKAVGVIYMLTAHQMVWLFMREDVGSLAYPQSEAVLRFFARMGLHFLSFQLPLLAALVFYLYARRPEFTWLRTLRQASLLAALEFLKNFFAWGAPDAFDWDVLPFIGLAMVISYPFIKKVKQPFGFWCLGVLAAAGLALSRSFPFTRFMDAYPYKVIFGDAAGEHYWPLFPWFALFAAGLWLGYVFERKSMRLMKFSAAAGLAMLAAAVASGRYLPALDMENIWGPAIFKPSLFFVLGIAGAGMLIVPLTHIVLECFPGVKKYLSRSPLLCLGQGILWIYLITIAAGYSVTGALALSGSITFHQALVLWPVMTGATLFTAYFIGRFSMRRLTVEYI